MPTALEVSARAVDHSSADVSPDADQTQKTPGRYRPGVFVLVRLTGFGPVASSLSGRSLHPRKPEETDLGGRVVTARGRPRPAPFAAVGVGG